MPLIKQLNFLLKKKHKKELLSLSALLAIGMVLEIGGIGILIPALSFLLNTSLVEKYSHYFGNLPHNTIIGIGLTILILFYILKGVFLVYLSYRQSKFTAALSVDLSKDLFKGYLHMPYAFHLQRNSSELQRNIQMEILHFGGISLAAMILSTEISAIIGISVLLVFMEPIGAISTILFFGFFAFLFNKKTNGRIASWGYSRQLYDGQAIKLLLEGLGGVKQVKLSGLEDFFLDKFHYYDKEKAKINAKIQVLNSVPRLYLEILAVIGVSLLILLMILQNKPIDRIIPILGIFVAAAFRMIPSINRIINSLQTIRFAESVVDVLSKEFTEIRALDDHKSSREPLSFDKQIEIENLSFSYSVSANQALTNINIRIKKGEFIGFIGTSGSGKSTLIDIIVGLLKPVEGKILVDGFDIASNVRSWQNMIGYVPQTIFLTDDTLRRNIAFGLSDGEINEERLLKALAAAQLVDFVKRLPEGLDTVVGERGVRLSGGERQRIGIARALYNDPPIIVLDEATSSLDGLTEKDFMSSVNALHHLKTILIVAHRLSTIEQCDRVFELKNGVLIRESQPTTAL